MHELNPNLGFAVQSAALDAAIRGSLGSKLIGVSSYGNARPISLWMDDSALPADDAAAQSAGLAHDPVFLSADKTSIQANGTDAATVTILTPKQGAAAVTLSVSVNGGAPSDWIPALPTDTFTASDPGTYAITVKNPSNRSTDQLTITAR